MTKKKAAAVDDKTTYVFQKSKIDYELSIRELNWTEKQKELINLIEDRGTRMVMIKGPAGSSKSILSIYAGLKALNSKKNSNIIYLRPILESADVGSKLGFLPGDKSQKEEPYKRVINEKLEELLNKGDVDKLNKENRIEFAEINFLRGASMNAVYLIGDEVQSYVLSELITLITRIGKYSKIILCADPEQSDLPINKQGGFMKLWDLFNDEDSRKQGIFSFEFNEDDIMRSEFCKFVVKKTRQLKEPEILPKNGLNGNHRNGNPLIIPETPLRQEEWSPALKN